MKRLLCWFWGHQWQRTRECRKDGGWTEQCQRCMSVRFRALKDIQAASLERTAASMECNAMALRREAQAIRATLKDTTP